VGYGNYDTWRGQLYIGGGITDNLAADIALNYLTQGEGWGKNLHNGHDTPTDYNEGIRTKWVWTGEETKVTFSADWQNNETGQGDMRIFQPGSVGANGHVHTGGFYDIEHNWPGGSNIPPNIPNGDSPVATSYVKNWGLTLKVDHQMSWADFVSITAHRELEQFNTFDNDGLPISLVDAQQDVNETETFTQEFQLMSNGEGRLDWIVGAFFLDDTSGYGGPNGLTLIGDHIIPIPGAMVSFLDPIETQSMAAFAEVTYDFTEATSLTVGARLTRETKEITGKQRIYFPPGVFGPDEVVQYIYFDETFEAANGVDLEETWTEPTFKISLNHNINDNVMVYGSYNRGFRSGSYNTVGVTGVPVKPELVDAYEIGFKSDLFDRRVRFNGAFFYYDFQDLQVVIARGASTDLLNAGEAEIYGFDGELEVSLSDNLTARAGLSLLETEYTKFEEGNLCSHRGPDGKTYSGDSPATVGQECNVTGNDMVRSPDTTFNIGFVYSKPLEYGIVGASLDYSWKDKFFWEVDNRLYEPSVGVLNGTLSWETPDEAFGVTLWGKNLTDEKYANFQVAQASCGADCANNPAGVGDHYSPAAPRTWGVDFNFRF
ncbi:MAG: TonB-dependent receptor, partial [Porticoccaceae bacterium]